MNAGELIGTFRTQTGDEAEPSLWGERELFLWLNEAEREACRRARLIVDTRNKTDPDNVCRITLVAGTEFYRLDPRVIYIRSARLLGRSITMEAMDYRDMDRCAPGWGTRNGNVTGYVRNVDTGYFRPYRVPDEPGFVDLTVVREPLHAMTEPEDEPELIPRYHLALLDWVMYRAYSKKDSQAYDPALAASHLATFEAEFGTKEKSAAFEEEWQRQTLPFNDRDGTY